EGKGRGYLIVAEYVDEGVAGDELRRRKEFQRLLRDAQTGQFDGILCDDNDRFGRFDSIDMGEIVAPLRRKGVWLESVAQGRSDWESFAGRVTKAVLDEAKSLEKDAISRRVLTNQWLKAQKGITTGGRSLYGYRWDADAARGKKLVPDGHKAEVVRLIFALYDRGVTIGGVAEELLRRGVASPRGEARWTRSVIQRLLSNRRYVGDWTWGVHAFGKRHRCSTASHAGLRTTKRADANNGRNRPEAWIVVPDSHEPLVDRDVFERVQARLKGNKVRTTPHANGGNFVLSKLLVC